MEVNDTQTFVSPHFNSLLEVREMTWSGGEEEEKEE